MAFLRTAYAHVLRPSFAVEGWRKVRTASADASKINVLAQASDILGEKFDPSKWLLSHASIVASVDTEAPANVKTGSVTNEEGQKILRKWADYYVTPETTKYINNNCFIPGTLITLADGSVRPIEAIQVGDVVRTHKGRPRRVAEVMVRQVSEELVIVYPSGLAPIWATKEHPFMVARGSAPPVWTEAKDIQRGDHLQTPCSDGTFWEHTVTDVVTVPYEGSVHNFEVEEDHSYVAGGVAVHNCDAFSRGVVEKSYRTFIGGHVFQEHVQIESHSKGRIIDAALRDVGESLYVDILLATNRRHSSLVSDIASGRLGTMSMGCFLAGAQVTMGDGRRVAIEDVQPGDLVLTHKGRNRPVVNKQIREYAGNVVHIRVAGRSIHATSNHGFQAVSRNGEQKKVEAGNLHVGSLLLAPETGLGIPVEHFEIYTYQGHVHNMAVEEDHTYVVEGVAVHNCTIAYSICTKCGNVAEDQPAFCSHVKYEKGNTFIDESGVRRKVAELCGSAEDTSHPTGGVTFFEASWVKVPAFEGAVMRNIIEPVEMGEEALAKVADKARKVFSLPAHWPKEDERKRAASEETRTAFDFGDMGEGSEGDSGASEGEGAKKEEEDKGPLDEAISETEDYVVSEVKKKIRKDISQRDQKNQVSDGELSESTNSSVIKQAAYFGGVFALVRTAGSDRELLGKLFMLEREIGTGPSKVLYKAALRVGPTSRYGSLGGFLGRCQWALGRSPTRGEARELLRLGKLLSERKTRR